MPHDPTRPIMIDEDFAQNWDACNRPDEMGNAVATLRALADYCEQKTIAMQFRLEGSIDLAMAHERKMERIYKSLPQWARW